MNSKRKDCNIVNNTSCLTTTLLVIRVVVGGWLEEEPRRIIDTRTSTVEMYISDTLFNYHLQPPMVPDASH